MRTTLRSSTPYPRQSVVAVLAGLGRPWCARELVAALEAHDTREGATEVLAAIARAALLVAEGWLRRHPAKARSGPGYSLDEMLFTMAAPQLAHDLQTRRAWLERVGPTIPENFNMLA